MRQRKDICTSPSPHSFAVSGGLPSHKFNDHPTSLHGSNCKILTWILIPTRLQREMAAKLSSHASWKFSLISIFFFILLIFKRKILIKEIKILV